MVAILVKEALHPTETVTRGVQFTDGVQLYLSPCIHAVGIPMNWLLVELYLGFCVSVSLDQVVLYIAVFCLAVSGTASKPYHSKYRTVSVCGASSSQTEVAALAWFLEGGSL